MRENWDCRPSWQTSIPNARVVQWAMSSCKWIRTTGTRSSLESASMAWIWCLRSRPVAAFISDALGLPGMRAKVAERFTDKFAMRRALQGKVPMPAFQEVSA